MLKKMRKKTTVTILMFVVSICIALAAGMGYKLYFKGHNNNIPVAYCTDKNYVYYTLVSMQSAVESANNHTFYKFVILLSDNVTQEEIEKFKTFDENNKNCSVQLINMQDQYNNSIIGGWSKAIYYRLNLPELLMNEKKCIYLDSDTMVRKDLYEMYSSNMENYYIAGVRDYNGSVYEGSNYCKVLGIDNLNTYVCSGVLIMNLEKMRNDGLMKKLQDAIEENDKNNKFSYMDQDILNSVCFGHILTLPYKFGALVTIAYWDDYYNKDDYIRWTSNEKDWQEGQDPTIVHFTALKPWIPERGTTPFHPEWHEIAERVKQMYGF